MQRNVWCELSGDVRGQGLHGVGGRDLAGHVHERHVQHHLQRQLLGRGVGRLALAHVQGWNADAWRLQLTYTDLMVLSLLAMLVAVTPELEEGRAAFSSLKYQQAITVLGTVTTSSVPSSEKAEAFGLMARAYLALGKTANAQAAFEGQLQEDPMAEEPPGAPKVKQAFLAAKRARFPPGYVQLVKRPSGEDSLVLDVVNPWRVTLVMQAWEATTGDFVKKAVMLDGLRLVLALPAGSKTWVQAVSAEGKPLATFASASEPVLGPKLQVVVVAHEKEKKPDAPVEVKTTPKEAPPAPPIVVTAPPTGPSANRVIGYTLIGVGAVAAIVGGIVAGIGSAEYAKGDGFPFTVTDLPESERLMLEGTTKMIAGGITAGVGGLSLIGGLLLAILSN